MSKARTLANLISDNAELADGQISVAEVVGAAPTASPTFTGNIDAGDNVKIRLGDSDDLQIYHDGSNSYIKDTGTGRLALQSSSDFLVSNNANTQNYIYAQEGGYVRLYYAGATKLATTSTGIDVTGGVNYTSGTLNYTGTSVPTGGNNQGLYIPTYAIGLGGTYSSLNFPTTASALTTTAWWMLGRAGGSNDEFTLRVRRGGTAGSDQTAYVVTTSGADSAKIIDNHKWYTGGTERMRIDSSGNVGIGTSSPSNYNSGSNNLVVGASSGDNGITIATGTTNGGLLAFADGTTGNSAYRGYIQYDHNSDFLAVGSAGTEAMRIDSSGHLLVGGTSSVGGTNGAALQVKGSTGSKDFSIALIDGNDQVAGRMHLQSTGSNSISIDADPENLGASTFLGFTVDGTERMRIDSSGRVGIGTSSPNSNSKLDVNGNLYATRLFVSGGGNSTDPMIRVSTDTNTGIFFPQADTLSITTAGSERLRMTSNGRQAYNVNATALGHANFVGEVGSSYKALAFEHTVGGGEVGSIRTTSSTAVYYGDGSNLTGVGGSTAFGAVGTYIWGRPANTTNYGLNATASGLYAITSRISSFGGQGYYRSDVSSWQASPNQTSVSGTWRHMGGAGSTFVSGFDAGMPGLWVRIS
jgi:hypothetical protein